MCLYKVKLSTCALISLNIGIIEGRCMCGNNLFQNTGTTNRLKSRLVSDGKGLLGSADSPNQTCTGVNYTRPRYISFLKNLLQSYYKPQVC